MDEWLTFIATSSILAKKSLPTMQEKWDKLPITDKTWAKWKNHFVDAQATIELATQDGSDSFGSANAASAFHGTYAPDPADDKIPSSTVENIDGYLNNPAAVATNKRDVINHLMANNKILNTTNVNTLAEIKTLLTNRENVHAGRGSKPG